MKVELSAWAIGVLDCLITFGLGLVEKGVCTREQIAAAFTECVRQGEEAAAAECGQDPASRTAAARALAEFFATPVAGDRRGFRVIEGGGDVAPSP